MPRSRRPMWTWILAALWTFFLCAPVWAAEGSSNFTKFLKTENPVGTGVIWFLLLTSVALLALVIQAFMRSLPQAYTPPVLAENLGRLLAEKNYREAIDLANADPSPFGQMMAAALAQASRGYTAMEQALEETAEALTNQRVRGLVFMEIAGAAGPMLGLFGTVIGMIVAFTKLVEAGGAPKPGELAGGISTALVCTMWGLIVGIPGVIFASFFRVRIEGLSADAFVQGQKLINQFRPMPGRKPTAAPAPAPAGAAAAPRKPLEASA
jgi:biopolymer transport protein ExbB